MINVNYNKILLYSLTFLVVITALRNVSSIYYVLVGLIILYFLIRNINSFFYIKKEIIYFYLFFLFTFFVFFWSSFFSPIEDLILAAPRLLLMPIMGFIFICELKTEKDFINIMKIVLISFSLGAISLIFQSYSGELSWVNKAHMRGYYIRYASILGSLTVFGSVVGYLFVLIYKDNTFVSNNIIKISLLLIIIFALALSLTKSGIGLLLAQYY